MSFPIEQLYRLSARDEQSSWLQPILVSGSQNFAGITLASGFIVSRATIIVGGQMLVRAVPGAGQRALILQALIQPPAPSTAVVLLGSLDVSNNPTVGLQHSLNVDLADIFIPENWRITAQIQYDAAGVANVLNTSLTGMQIPHGNVDRV